MRFGKWETIRSLGQGGQGVVHLAINTAEFDIESEWRALRDSVHGIAAASTEEDNRRNTLALLSRVERYLNRESDRQCGALKVLHEAARVDEKARARLEQEVRILLELHNPYIVRLLDASVADGWFVVRYHREGTLASNLATFAGRPIEALDAFRPLLAAVATLHQHGTVHRDIKPENIFLSGAELVLGDFGIAYFHDEAKTRVSDIYENVGSRDWMPGWAMGMRVDEVRPSFDVFCLGKVLWAMVSGRTKMRLWYFRDPEFDLCRQFPTDERMLWINRLLAGSVVEREDQCWPSAAEMLHAVDDIRAVLRRRGQVVHRNVSRYCVVCGMGQYRRIAEGGGNALANFGFDPRGPTYQVFECMECGHVQLFRMDQNPPSWRR